MWEEKSQLPKTGKSRESFEGSRSWDLRQASGWRLRCQGPDVALELHIVG